MQKKSFEKFEVVLYDAKNNITNSQEFYSKDEAVNLYERYRELYKDTFVVFLYYTKVYISYPKSKIENKPRSIFKRG